jgi:hypothetical protein
MDMGHLPAKLNNGFQLVYSKLSQGRTGSDTEIVANTDSQELDLLRPYAFRYSSPGGVIAAQYGDGVTATYIPDPNHHTPILAVFARSQSQIDDQGRPFLATYCVLFPGKELEKLDYHLAWFLFNNRIAAPKAVYTAREKLNWYQPTFIESEVGRARQIAILDEVFNTLKSKKLYFDCLRALYNDDSPSICFVNHDPALIPHITLALSLALTPEKRQKLSFMTAYTAGARADGQVANNAEHIGLDWDGIWDAAARITGEGWTVEMAIPFKTLRFKPGQTTWGLNVKRHIKRLNEVNRWSAPRRDVWFSNLAEAGRLDGLIDIQQGWGLELRPFGSITRADGDGEFDGGFDLFKNVTPNLTASLTVNTDFAETEVDERQINLTRFPLFFPEKRAFFLEGAPVFETAGLDTWRSDLVPFFTRRIGLLGGGQVPIGAGVKVVGRQSGFNIGLLDVQTRDVDTHPDAGQNLFAARVSRNILRQSWIGAIVTRGNPARARPRPRRSPEACLIRGCLSPARPAASRSWRAPRARRAPGRGPPR